MEGLSAMGSEGRGLVARRPRGGHTLHRAGAKHRRAQHLHAQGPRLWRPRATIRILRRCRACRAALSRHELHRLSLRLQRRELHRGQRVHRSLQRRFVQLIGSRDRLLREEPAGERVVGASFRAGRPAGNAARGRRRGSRADRQPGRGRHVLRRPRGRTAPADRPRRPRTGRHRPAARRRGSR